MTKTILLKLNSSEAGLLKELVEKKGYRQPEAIRAGLRLLYTKEFNIELEDTRKLKKKEEPVLLPPDPKFEVFKQWCGKEGGVMIGKKCVVDKGFVKWTKAYED